MQELDEVFSRSGNQDVAGLLRKIQSRVDGDILQLQNEN